jgi:hypothetical protein
MPHNLFFYVKAGCQEVRDLFLQTAPPIVASWYARYLKVPKIIVGADAINKIFFVTDKIPT